MPSKTEQMLTALTERLRKLSKVKVERNTAAPERIPKGRAGRAARRRSGRT